MSGWVILVDHQKDMPNAETPHKVISAKDYLARPQLFENQRPKIINLSRRYDYQTRGYYCSLLAEARGHRVLPTVEAILELSGEALYRHALPELEESLDQAAARLPSVTSEPFSLLVCFGRVADPAFERFGRLAFDWFRAPAFEVQIKADGRKLTIVKLRQKSIHQLTPQQREFFSAALHAHTRREWKSPKNRSVPDWSIAVLHDPDAALPPSGPDTLKHFARVAEKMGVEVEPIVKRDLARLAEFDALFIRETTSIDDHTYRFARRAQQEGMPVIDDPISMIRCTNKVYLHEVMTKAAVPTPKTLLLSMGEDLARAADELGFPVVLKAPDSSFSRGVHKAESQEALQILAKRLFKDTDMLLAQEFMPTTFDWRVGVLAGRPIFTARYKMARGHWQIVRHRPDGKVIEGGAQAVAVEDAPAAVVETAVKAAGLIGDGLYGVDNKETDGGVAVIEINDNPDIHHGWEDEIAKDAVWRALVTWFVERLEA